MKNKYQEGQPSKFENSLLADLSDFGFTKKEIYEARGWKKDNEEKDNKNG